MFEKKNLVFYYCTSPLHMGAGTSVGAIDNPIQREIHSGHPIIAGSGLKGAVRHHVNKLWNNPAEVVSLFGSVPNDSPLVAGAISFTDANLIAFPVRSVKNTFVYITSPYALGRLKRLAVLAGLKFDWDISSISESGAGDTALDQGKLCLEAYEFNISEDEEVAEIAEWIAEHCLPNDDDNHAFFKEKIKSDFYVLSDDAFNFFVKQATVVEPHVRIDDATGTAMDGALFYTENLPPESILAGIVLASIERKQENAMSAEECINKTLFDAKGISKQLIQMGGDATTGRGLVLLNAVKEA